MKIGAYQFAVTGHVESNFNMIKQAVELAANEGIQLLVFPECALTGYPPHDIACSAQVDFDAAARSYRCLQELSDTHDMHIVVGSVTREKSGYRNGALLFSPRIPVRTYYKRALWGWDRENFRGGNGKGVFEIAGLRVGIRICFEVRFPEFFRELYAEHTDLNLILFYDVSDRDDVDRYELIKSHIRTRAVENVCYTLSVCATCPCQTAPTALYDRSGTTLSELERDKEGLLVYDLTLSAPNFGECGRIEISNLLTDIKKV